MAKVVSFKAKNVFGKDFNIVDTYDNVKKLNQGLIAMLKAIDELESKKKDNVTLMDYQEVISEEVITQTGKILGLTKTDAEKLKDMSYSEVFDFYKEITDKFLHMAVPSVEGIRKAFGGSPVVEEKEKDPKSKEDN